MITDKQKQSILDLLKKYPIVQVACEKSGVARSTYYRWRKEDEEFRKAIDDALSTGSELINDMAESQLISAIKDRNLGAISMWLKAHHSNYSNKIIIDGKVEVENTPLSIEQQTLIKKALHLVGIDNPQSYE